MDPESAARLLGEISRQAADAGRPDEVLAATLDGLLDLSGARSVWVARASVSGPVVAVQAGAALDGAADAGHLSVEDRHLTELPVPGTWAGVGITRVAARRLPGDAGVLVLAWVAAERPSEWLDVALAAVDSAVERAYAEQQFADLVARVDNAQQLANMGDYDWHIPTDTNRWSDQLYRIYGHEPQSFNASYERFIAHIHPDDRDRITGIHQHSYSTGEPYEMIERIVRPDGQVRYLASNGQVLRDAADIPVRMRGTCIDITDRVRAEQARERSAARFRGLVESAPDAILVLDSTGQVLQANRHASGLLGADPTGRAMAEIASWPLIPGEAVPATALDGRPLQLDVQVAALSDVDDEGLVAAFVRDAAPRLGGEALAATLREAVVRRRQALEINDNVVQGLTVAIMTMQEGDVVTATDYIERTLAAARRMMNDWLEPLDGQDLQPGDLIRLTKSRLDDARPTIPGGRTVPPA